MAAAAVLLVAPVPASAGGPTSVLLVSPTRQVATALYHSDAAYTRLQELLGETPGNDPLAPALKGGPGTDAINVTWLIHDVQVWRVDRIFMAQDGPWIETNLNRDGTLKFDQSGVVHRASDAKALVELLAMLKLIGPAPPPANQGMWSPATASPQTVTTPVQTAASERDAANIDWLWMLVGAAAGAVLVVGLRPLVRRRRPV